MKDTTLLYPPSREEARGRVEVKISK